MKQRDKNIFSITIFVIIFLLVWTISHYNTTKKDAQNQRELTTQQEQVTELEQINELENVQNIIPTISITDLNHKIFTTDAIKIIDTRTLEAFNAGHIKNSIHVSEFDINQQNQVIVFITATGNEEPIISYYTAMSDKNDIYNLTGGFNIWKKSGQNIITLEIKQNFENKTKLQLVEPRDLNKLLTDTSNNDFVIIDTRRSGNYEKSHIQNAINIPFTQLEHRYKEIPIAKETYVYGADEKTSFNASVLIHDLGFINNKTINGGFAAWTEYDYPTVQ